MTRQVTIYISAYVEAANRDAFMAVKQDLLAERNGARLARNRLQVAHTSCLPWARLQTLTATICTAAAIVLCHRYLCVARVRSAL